MNMIIQSVSSSFVEFEGTRIDFVKNKIINLCRMNNYKEIEYLLDANRCTLDELVQILSTEDKDDNELPTFVAFYNGGMEALKSLLDISLKRGILDCVLALKTKDVTLLHLLCYFGSYSKVLNDWFCQFCPKEFLSSALKMEGLSSYLPLFFAIQQSQNNTLRMFLRLCPEAIFFNNSDMKNLLTCIFIKGNSAVIECVEECLSSFECKDYWTLLANTQSIYGLNPFYELIRPTLIKVNFLEESRIEVLKKMESRIGKDTVLPLLLHSQGSILCEGISNGWFKIADHVMQHYAEIRKSSFVNGESIWHRLAVISVLTTDRNKDEKDKIQFFKKYFLSELTGLDQKNNDGLTPLYIARYISKFRYLANSFEKSGADAIAAHKFHYSKLLAHVWSIVHTNMNPNIDKAYPYLARLNGWKIEASMVEMINNLGYFLEEISPKERFIYERVYDQINTAFQACLSLDIEKIKKLIDENELWALPISTPKHSSFLLGQGNYLIFCDRSVLTICSPDRNIVVPPRLMIYELPIKLTESQILQLQDFEGNLLDFFRFLKELNVEIKETIRLKKQPANTCTWTSAKTCLLAAFLIREMQNAKPNPEENIEIARFYYSKWSNFTRWRTLAIYKKIVEPSNPLIEAVESKAILTHMIKFIKQNPELLKGDPKLEAVVDFYLFSKSSKKLDKLIHNFNKIEERNSIIQALYKTQNEFLNSELKSFAVNHHLKKYIHLDNISDTKLLQN